MERNDPTDSVREIRRFLLGAYDEAKRELPWRGETDPYRVWVSEIMLQQTRVETVIPYYKEWVKRFPDLESLAFDLLVAVSPHQHVMTGPLIHPHFHYRAPLSNEPQARVFGSPG